MPVAIGTARLSDTAGESTAGTCLHGPALVISARQMTWWWGVVVEVTTKGFRLDLSDAQWLTTKCGGPDRDNCVEVAFVGQAIAVRDSQNPAGPALIFTAAEWDAFLGGAKDGEFDL
jgi:hypothetical protein